MLSVFTERVFKPEAWKKLPFCGVAPHSSIDERCCVRENWCSDASNSGHINAAIDSDGNSSAYDKAEGGKLYYVCKR